MSNKEFDEYDERFYAEAFHQPTETETTEWHELADTLSRIKYALRSTPGRPGSFFISTVHPRTNDLTVTCSYESNGERQEITVTLQSVSLYGMMMYDVQTAITELKRQKEERSSF